MTEPIQVELLEARAAEQRRRLHNNVQQLRETVRERLDVKRNVRRHFMPAAGIVGLVALVLGYSVTGAFTDR